MNRNRLKKIKEGDLQELDKIYLEVKPLFVKFAQEKYKNTPYEVIEDVFQDTIVDLYHNIKTGALEEIHTSLSAYLIYIGNSKLGSYLNESKQVIANDSYFAENAIELDEYDHKIDNAVKFILTKMNDSCKKILNLFYFNKKSLDEIAYLLGYKNGDVVKVQKSRCISSISAKVNKIVLEDED
jgi:RNA polymerase sigma-70 factor (ECF subfamily)